MTCSLAWLAIPDSQVPPDNFSYSACISALRGRWSMALALLTAKRCSSLRSNEVTYNAAITACGDRWQPVGTPMYTASSEEIGSLSTRLSEHTLRPASWTTNII